MPFNQKPQKFNAKINSVTIGNGDKTVTIGGENSFPFYSFDAPTENAPKIGVEISDLGLDEFSEGVKAYYEGATTMADIAKKAAAIEGADFVALILDGGDTNTFVSADWNRTIQIVSNLLSNAVKFTSRGEIHFGFLNKENFVEFYVRDTGIGIPAERAATIFQRFGKVDDFVQGTGLGLTLCKMLVEKMGGHIRVCSKEDEGTTFYFTLPLANR